MDEGGMYDDKEEQECLSDRSLDYFINTLVVSFLSLFGSLRLP